MNRRLAVGLLAVTGLLGLLIGLGADRLIGDARVGAGFAAKALCSSVFLSDRPAVVASADLPANPMVDFLEVDVDREAGSVRTSIFGVGDREARYLDGLGCVLLPPGQSEVGFEPAAVPIEETPWPGGEAVTDAVLPGLDRAALDAALDREFSEADPERPRRARAVVVVQGGRVVAERYAEGFGRDTPLIGWSMTKSVTNALVGILVGEGRLDVESSNLFPGWWEEGDPRREITLDDLLRMSSGLEFVEDYGDLGSDVVQMLYVREDAGQFAADHPLVGPPGSRWEYSSGTTNIVTSVMEDAFDSRAAYLGFPRSALFNPLGMTTAVLEADASGSFMGSSFMYASARDWARFGLLYLNDGVWNGERVLPEGWVRYSLRQTAASERGDYGASWWINRPRGTEGADRRFPDLPQDFFWASGHEGQRVAVFPSHDLVVVRLGMSQYGNWDDERFLRDVLAAFDHPVKRTDVEFRDESE